jgi:Meiotically up-regulated gene 113
MSGPLRTCTAYWKVPAARDMCGLPAPHEVADTFFCDHHYERALRWAAEIGRAGCSLVYYLQRVSDGLIKIGTSRTLISRFAALRSEHGPLLLMAAHRGAHKEEHAIHDYFAELRAGGEWFRPDVALLEHILKVRSADGGRTPEGLPEQMDLLELGRMVCRLKRAVSPVAVPVAVRPDLLTIPALASSGITPAHG